MSTNRYDRIIWRINGAIIAVGGLLALGIMILASYQMYREIFRGRHVSSVVNVNKETMGEEALALGGFYRLTGSNWLVANLEAHQDYRQDYYSKSASSIRNCLFFNLQDNTTKWLLSNNSSLVLTEHALFDNIEIDLLKRKLLGYIYELVTKDTNGDNRLTRDDKKAIIIYRLEAQGPKSLIDNIDVVKGVEQISANEALIFYQSGTEASLIRIDLVSGNTGSKQALPSIN